MLTLPARFTIDRTNCWLVADSLFIFLSMESIAFLRCFTSSFIPEHELFDDAEEELDDDADLVLSFRQSSIVGRPSNTG